MDYQELCDRIFAMDERIRYATVTDHLCNVLAGGMRPGVAPIESSAEQSRKVDLQVTILDGIMRTWGESLGRAKFALIQHAKAYMLIVPFDEKHVEVSIKTTMPLDHIEGIIRRIEYALKKARD